MKSIWKGGKGMRLRSNGSQEYWELVEEEIAARRGTRTSRYVAADTESEAVQAQVQWTGEPGEGIELHFSIKEELRHNQRAVFSGQLVRMSQGLLGSLKEVRARYSQLERPSFGHAGAAGFFAGRQLLAFEAEFLPQETSRRSDQDGFLGSLFKAVIRHLPGYNPDCHVPLSWILSRHDQDVEAMPFHHDRVGWLAQFCIDRTPGVQGGSIELQDQNGMVVVTSSLKAFLDGYIVRDEVYKHGTTGMKMEHPGVDRRDVIVIRLPAMDLAPTESW